MVKISSIEKDAILEIVNIFSYQTSIALQDILNKPVDLNISKKDVIALEERPKTQKAPIMYLNIFSALTESDLEGNIVLTFPKDSALGLYDLLCNKPIGNTKIVDEAVTNAFIEVGNIISGKISSVINKCLGLNVHHSIPSVVPAFGDMIYDYVYFNIEEKNKEAILIKVDTIFKLENQDIEGELILLLSHSAFDSLLEKINNIAGVT